MVRFAKREPCSWGKVSAIRGLQNRIVLRYAAAIVLTSSLMVWQSASVLRTFDGFSQHAAFWTASVTAGWLQMIFISRGVRATFGAHRYPGWALLLISALIGAAPLTFEVRWLMETIVAPERGLLPPWRTYLNVSVINMAFCLVQYALIEHWPLLAADDAANEPAAPQTALAAGTPTTDVRPPTVQMLRRPPENLSGLILYLRAEDHYLHVRSDAGSGMVLHRMSDAADDLRGSDGMQVHRSWWASRTAVRHVRRSNRKTTLQMSDGQEIPVGRSYEKKLKDAGWF